MNMKDYTVKLPFADVEIRCSDDKVIYFSKFILVQCSGFFSKELSKNPQNSTYKCIFPSKIVNLVLNKICGKHYRHIDCETALQAAHFCNDIDCNIQRVYYDTLLANQVKSLKNNTILNKILQHRMKVNLPITMCEIDKQVTAGKITSFKGIHYNICCTSPLDKRIKWLMDNEVDFPDYCNVIKEVVVNFKTDLKTIQVKNFMAILARVNNPQLTQEMIEKIFS